MRKSLTTAVLSCLVSHGSACLAADPDLPGIQSLKNIDAIDRSASVDLVTKGGASADQKLRAIKKAYPHYRLVSGCIGSFKNDGAHDVAVALVNPSTKTAIYTVGMSNPGTDSILEIAKFSIKFNDRGVIPKSLEVLCESRTELLRIVQEYSAPRTEAPAASAIIRPISYFDAVCLAPFAQPEDFVCYGYSNSSKSFVKIGSWFND